MSHTSASAMPIRPIHRYTWCQPQLWTTQAISGVKTTAAKYCAALKMADAVPRSAVGNQLATTLALAGKAGDSARPTAKRSANSTVMAEPMVANTPSQPCSSVKNDQTKMLAA
ncbi:hypothetical protein D3C71_1508560 [compost metagenome]